MSTPPGQEPAGDAASTDAAGDDGDHASDDAPTMRDRPDTADGSIGPSDRQLRADVARAAIGRRLFGIDAPPRHIGRFVVLRLLGTGATGSVFAAYDEQLDRKVAVKLLRGAADDLTRKRTLREARAMARLRHDNIVQFYEVGEHGQALYIAMEFVDGETLRDWQARGARSRTDIVDAYMQAARGLAAAHDAGIVHRDFKPHNALVASRPGAGLEVRVLDFGLAIDRSVASLTVSSDEDSRSADSARTLTGAIAGTPAYMAPEQLRGGTIDARADQYALCVALWEALYGEHPVGGATLDELSERVLAGLRAPVPTASVPRRLQAALERGMSLEPEQRWPDMKALIEAVSGQSGRIRRRRISVGAASLALIATAGAGGVWLGEGREQPCSGAERKLQGVWDVERRAGVHAALSGSDASFAELAAARTTRELDAYATDWVAMHEDACEASVVRGEQSPAVLDLRMACLERARVELQAATEALADPTRVSAANADAIVPALPALDVCANPEALQTNVGAPSAAEADAVAHAQRALARAKTAYAAAQMHDALAGVEAAKKAMGDVRYAPLRIEVSLVEGRVLSGLGKPDEAERVLEAALDLAARDGRVGAMQKLATTLLYVVGARAGRPAEALQRYRLMAESLPAEGPKARVGGLLVVGQILHAAGRWDESEAILREGLDTVADGSHNQIALGSQLATVYGDQGKFVEADREHRRVLRMLEERLGSEHPDTIVARCALASTLVVAREHAEAAELFRVSLRSMIAQSGPDHPDVASAHLGLAAALDAMGAYAESEGHLVRARSIFEATFGQDHAALARVDWLLFNAFYGQGRYGEAVEAAERVHRTFERALGPEHPETQTALTVTAHGLRLRGRLTEAEAVLREATDRLEALLGSTHLAVRTARLQLAECLFEQGRLPESKAEYRRVVELGPGAAGDADPLTTSATAGLATVLDRQGEHERARIEYERALAQTMESLGPTHRDSLAVRENIALGKWWRGALEEAELELRKVLASRLSDQGASHPDVAVTRMHLGHVLAARGEDVEAGSEYALALGGLESALGSRHPTLAVVRGRLAELALRRGDPEEALAQAELAWACPLRDELAPGERARLAFVVARSIWEGRSDRVQRARAIEIGRAAVLAYETAGVAASEEIERARTWLELRDSR